MFLTKFKLCRYQRCIVERKWVNLDRAINSNPNMYIVMHK